MTTFRKPYQQIKKSEKKPFDHSRTKQEFKTHCNINCIMETYQKTGVISHGNSDEPTFGIAPSIDLLEAQLTLKKAEEMFSAVSPKIRAQFQNSPLAFVEFCENPENRAKMAQMGLLSPAATNAFHEEQRLKEEAKRQPNEETTE